jgi:hypothetical protein
MGFKIPKKTAREATYASLRGCGANCRAAERGTKRGCVVLEQGQCHRAVPLQFPL